MSSLGRQVQEFIAERSSYGKMTPNRMRNAKRRVMYKELQNAISSEALDFIMMQELRCMGKSWLREFIDLLPRVGNAQYEHERFRDLIISKVKKSNPEDRAKEVKVIIENLNYQEVYEYCHGNQVDAAEYMTSHMEEIVRKQEIIAVIESGVDPIEYFKKIGEIKETDLIVEDDVKIEEYIQEGLLVNSEVYDFKVNNLDDAEKALEICNDGNSTVEYVDGRYENKNSVFLKNEIVNHEVEKMVNKRYRGKSLPVVVYAPPHSGKTKLNFETRQFLDTDSVFLWREMDATRSYITNIPNVIEKAIFSIAIIPTRKEFERRCYLRGLNPKPTWYSDVIFYANKANIRILSNKYLLQLPCIRDCFMDIGDEGKH